MAGKAAAVLPLSRREKKFRHSWPLTTALAGGGILVGLLLVEAGLRLIDVPLAASFYAPDPEIGWALRPGASGWSLGESRTHVTINSRGLRDREHTLQKPAGSYRIAVLGDSYTEALNVEVDQAWWAVLERELADCRALNGLIPEVINFGVSGYGTAQELLMLRHRVRDYHPDLVILGFYPGNDLYDNHPLLNFNPSRQQAPFFRLEGEDVVLDDSFRRAPKLRGWAIRLANVRGNLANRSRVLQLVFKVVNDLRTSAARPSREKQTATAGVELREEQLFTPPTDQRIEEAWGLTEALIAATDREAVRWGARFLLIVIPARPQVHPDPAWKAELAARLGAADLSYPDQRLRALADRKHLRILPLTEPLAAYAEANNAFLHGGTPFIAAGEGHWNATAHRLAARTIAVAMCADLAAESSQIPSDSK